MPDVQTHYDEHLAPIYAWSTGGAAAALDDAARWLATLPLPSTGADVLDLGAGFGATAIPLARTGHRVTAVDTSAALLAELAAHAGALAIGTEQADLVGFLRAQQRTYDVVLCVGDTVPHLPSHDAVEALVAEIARVLSPTGRAVLSYRPRRELLPEQRFVLVRAEAGRTLTAFLEPIDDRHQIVWDMIHETDGGRTTMRVSGYRKLRIEPAWLAGVAAGHGLAVDEAAPYRGMTVQILRRRG
jgi:2-polyprenyl-3-methyl-5-hydroxy-6-metoxy-1,4-benzoquinol methylase